MLILDVYNLLHLPEAADLDVPGLCVLIGQSRYAGQRCIAVCDGFPGTELLNTHADIRKQAARLGHTRKNPGLQINIRGIEVVFVGSGRSADDRIEQLLIQHRGRGRDISLVSSDRRLRRAAKRARAISIVSSTFLDRLIADSRQAGRAPIPAFSRDIPLDPYSVVHWLTIFGMKPTGVPVDRHTTAQRPPSAPQPPEPPLTETIHINKPPRRSSGSGPPANPPTESRGNSRPEDHSHLADDPLLREALAHWQGRLTLDELDMTRWLDTPGPPHNTQP